MRQPLGVFLQQKRRTDDRGARRRTPLALGPPDPQRHFTPARHGLTETQCRLANALLRKAALERPLRGTPQQICFKHALRCGGILNAIRQGLVGNKKFGRHLQGYRGGNTMRDHALHHLRTIAPIGHLAALVAYENRQAAQYYEATGQVLPIGTTPPAPSVSAAYIQSLTTAWETAQWQTQQAERLRW